MEEQGHGQVTNLLFRVLVRRYEVDSFEVAEIDVPSQDIYVQELSERLAFGSRRGARGEGRQRRTLQTYFFL